MEATYRRDSEHNYMIIRAPEGIQGDEYQIRMLLVNEIPGLLQCRLRSIDGISWFYYEITSRQPLARVFEHRPTGYEDVRALVLALGRTMEAMDRYLLMDGGLILEPELIYMDVETREVSFCYLPSADRDIAESFRALAEYLLKKLDHEDERAVFWGYQLYSMTTEENYSVRAALRSLRNRQEEKVADRTAAKDEEAASESDAVISGSKDKNPKPKLQKPAQTEKPPARTMITGQEHLKLRKKRIRAVCIAAAAICLMAAIAALTAFHVLTLTQAGGLLFLAAAAACYIFMGNKEKKTEGKEKKAPQKNAWLKRKEHKQTQEKQIAEKSDEKMPEVVEAKAQYEEEVCEFSEEDDEEVYGQTTLLGEETGGGEPVLISSSPDLRENVVIDREKFVIGKLKGQVDLALNLPMISRIHAGIERRNGNYFLVDMNSTNGTFLNGKRLEANEYRQIHTGDEINFAGAGYYFMLRS